MKAIIMKLVTIMFIIGLSPVMIYAGVPYVDNVMITDVTPRSFSVIWASSEASDPVFLVYNDAAGTIPTVDAVITLQPVENSSDPIGDMAEENGVLKARVTGLLSDTAYYFQTVTTSKSTTDVTYYPATTPLASVTTESMVTRTKMCGNVEIPFTNDLIVTECYLPDGSTPAQGTLLVVEVEGCGYPLSRFVGDGVAVPEAYVDLNNLFGYQSYQTQPLYGGQIVTLTKFMGIHGMEAMEHYVPMNRQLAAMKSPLSIPLCEGDFNDDGDVDGSDLALFAAGFGRTDCCEGSPCRGDFYHDGDVDGSDLAIFAADFGRTNCP